MGPPMRLLCDMWAVALTLAAFLGAQLARSRRDAATRPVGIRRVVCSL